VSPIKTLFIEQKPLAAMRVDQKNLLTEFLTSNGIRPSSFAYWLSKYVKEHPSENRSVLSVLLSAQLREQAEIIEYHLRH
jgi:hypothetical protein